MPAMRKKPLVPAFRGRIRLPSRAFVVAVLALLVASAKCGVRGRSDSPRSDLERPRHHRQLADRERHQEPFGREEGSGGIGPPEDRPDRPAGSPRRSRSPGGEGRQGRPWRPGRNRLRVHLFEWHRLTCHTQRHEHLERRSKLVRDNDHRAHLPLLELRHVDHSGERNADPFGGQRSRQADRALPKYVRNPGSDTRGLPVRDVCAVGPRAGPPRGGPEEIADLGPIGCGREAHGPDRHARAGRDLRHRPQLAGHRRGRVRRSWSTTE